MTRQDLLDIVTRVLAEEYNFQSITEETRLVSDNEKDKLFNEIVLIHINIDLESELKIEIDLDTSLKWVFVKDIINTLLPCLTN